VATDPMDGGRGRARLALNQATVQRWSAVEAIEGCARHGIGHVGLWRERVAEVGAAAVRRALAATGVRPSSLCRGGFFTAASETERRARLDDNRRAIEEAASVGAEVLVVVCGGVVGRDIEGSRAMAEAAVAELAPFAAAAGVRLGVEPLHPLFAADRSVVCTLGQATAMVERIASPAVGLVVDAYHVWWDEGVHERIAEAGGRIVAFHVDDWLAPPPDPLLGRGLMGDGCIDLRALRRSVDRAGYAGPIEVEIFNRELWDAPCEEVLARVVERYRAHVLDGADRPPPPQRRAPEPPR
jgi:sugar phosphate isomerase/epimerase